MAGFHYFDIRHKDSRAISSMQWPPLPPGTIPGNYSFLLQAEWIPGLLNADRKIRSIKKFPRNLPGIEPVSSSLKAQCLNQLRVLPHHSYWKNLKYFHVQRNLGEFCVVTLSFQYRMPVCLQQPFLYIEQFFAFKTTSGAKFVTPATSKYPVAAPVQLLAKLLPEFTTGIQSTAFCQTNGIQSERTHPPQTLLTLWRRNYFFNLSTPCI